MGPAGPTTIPEFLTGDVNGDLYVAEGRNWEFRKYVRKLELPDGAGNEIVERACALCHDFREFPRVNFDHEHRNLVVQTMVGGGAPLKKEEIPVVVDYLANSFKAMDPPGVVVSGSVQVTTAKWDVPTPNSMPYGIFHCKTNGFTWFTEAFGNAIGRFDPKTQQFKEYNLRLGANPSALVEFQGGNRLGGVSFAPQTGGFVGEFHPVDGPYATWAEGDVLEYPIPDPKLPPHDMAGGVWFTATEASPPLYPEGSKIGRLNISSTEIRLVDTPTASAAPHDKAVNSRSVLFFTERNSARLGSVNPATMQVTEYLLQNPESEARGITITPNDVVWYTDYNRGCLRRFDPHSGAKGRPYGITHVGNIIWYAEAGTKPNMLVRFDPKTEKFQTWRVSEAGGIRRIYADAYSSL
jgi:virginiamycin B lyase